MNKAMMELSERVKNIHKEHFTTIDPRSIMDSEREIKGNTIGMVGHKYINGVNKNDAVIKISEDGVIDIFANSKSGIRIHPSFGIQFIGPSVKIFADRTDIYTSDMLGFTWNTLPFNIGAVAPGVQALIFPPPQQVNKLQNMLKAMKDFLLPGS